MCPGGPGGRAPGTIGPILIPGSRLLSLFCSASFSLSCGPLAFLAGFLPS